MNQYPGFVPMVVPQPYMVAMPTAIPMSGAVGPGLPALPQALHPQVAAAHVAGAPVVTSSVVGAPGMASAVRAAQLSQGVAGQLAQGMGHLTAQGMSHLATQGMGHLGIPGIAGMPQPHPHQGNMSIPTAKVIPQIPSTSSSPDLRKRPFGDQDRGRGGRFGNRWQSNPEQDVEESNIDDSLCVLDHFNSDLNLNIDHDGCGASVLLDPPGFCFTWAGARATHGVCKGKVYYEMHILEHLPADFGDDHQEVDPHVVRVGWSIDSSSFQLGEEPWSFGYGGTGKFSTNCRFSDYGQRFGAGDVIGAMLDLDSRPATISFTKNGTWFGVAIPLHGFPVGSKDMALYPHILSKNCRVKVNFGQMDAWFPPPQGFSYIGQLPVVDRVRGMKCPERKADCEMIMIVGLPGVGKTTWGINMQKSNPEKRYNIIGTDTLIDKMRVMGLPRKRNYHGRWEVLIDKSTKCLNKLFQVASRRKRNYILDQTNVYASARRRKMKFFNGFFRIAAVLQPEDSEMQRRSHKRTVEDGKVVPESAVLEMKANFSLPEDRDNLFDRIDFIELPRDKTMLLLEQYVREGQEKRPPREEVFRHDSRYHKQDQNVGYSQQGSRPSQNQSPYGQRPMMGGPSKSPVTGASSKSPMGVSHVKSEPQWYGEGDGLLGRAPDLDENASKRHKLDQGRMGSSQMGGALDLLKQQYDEVEAQDSAVWNQTQSQDFASIKEEPHWSAQGQDAGLTLGLHGTPLPSHLAQHAGALVVSHPPGAIPLGAQPPPPPPPVLPGQLAHTAAGHAIVALTPLPPPGPPPTMLAIGGPGALGAAPPGFAHLQQLDNGDQQLWQQGGPLIPHSHWQQSDVAISTSSLASQYSQVSTEGSGNGREWDHQQGDKGRPGGLQGGHLSSFQGQDRLADSIYKTQASWLGQDRSDSSQKTQSSWQGSSGAQQPSWQSQEGPGDGQRKGGQQTWQGGQQQSWTGQDRLSEPNSRNNWLQSQASEEEGRLYEDSRDKMGTSGTDRDNARSGTYDSKTQAYSDSDLSSRRFDDFSRPPPEMRAGGRSSDFNDSHSGRGFGGGHSYGDSGGDRWGSQQRATGNDRWSSSSRQDRPGPQDSADNRWIGGSRQDSRDSLGRWASRSQDRQSGGRDHDRGRDMDRGRDRDRGGDRDRGVDRDRDRSGRDRDQDRDSYRDSYRDRDRGSRDRDHDSSEPRQRRRKSKWDAPEDDAGSKSVADSDFQQPGVKEELPSGGFRGPPPSAFQSNQQQQFYGGSGQYQSPDSADSSGQNVFPPRGMNFSKPPPAPLGSGPSAPSSSVVIHGSFGKDGQSELPSLMDVQFDSRPNPTTTSGRDRGNHGPTGGETSLLGPVPSGPPPKFQSNTNSSTTTTINNNNVTGSGPMPNTSLPPPKDGPPPPPFGGVGLGMNRLPFQPGSGPRFSGPTDGFRMDGPPRSLRPRNPQNFSGPPGNMGPMGNPSPNAPWNQNHFGGGGGRGAMPHHPRFDGPGGPGGGRFPGLGPMRWPRGPR